ncbi:lysosome-associated membrane glycoprotein 2-like isoform X1 [Echeneis naucrates]|uniref:lysosome-associated membrane glycoprotein 2-like isoform X1 n=1 Tax=Echeneis naucrates TaxID=173247 RepID=UPI00111351A7|nr:lysosome-associated membrane glycoprotein 2-like isoform X1 [Echeneis naucrates]
MPQRGHTGGWCLFFVAALIPGAHLGRNDSSVNSASNFDLPSGAQIYRPVLQPSESTPHIGTYALTSLAGKPCIKATMGVEYIVIQEKKTWYFNLEPSSVSTSGSCGKDTAVLSLTLPDNAAGLQLTFRMEKKFFFITKLAAHVSPQPVCQTCANKTYFGLLDHSRLFTTADGLSFKCQSGYLLLMSSELWIKLVPLQIQAFTLPKGKYGKEMECWADFNKQVVPVIVGAVVVGLILTLVLTHLFIKDRRRHGYEAL